MKKFLIKLALYVVLLAAVTLAVNACYFSMSVKNISGVPNRIDICNFGASHGHYGFNYEDFKGKYVCSNFALDAQPLYYDYRILQCYKNRIKPGASAFIVVSYNSLFGKPESYGASFLSRNIRYYRLLPPDLIVNYNWSTNIFVNYLPASSVMGITDFIKGLLHKGEMRVSYEKFNDEGNSRTTTSSDALVNASSDYVSHIANAVDKNGQRMRRQDAIDSVYAMISLCREIGVRPILLTMPFAREYTDTVRKNDPKFFEDFYALIDEIRQKTGVEYYDYAFDERFWYKYSLFIDSHHLNRQGARIFTRILLREVLGITPD